MVKRLNYFWGFVIFGVVAGAIFVVNKNARQSDLSRAEIVRILHSKKIELVFPRNYEDVSVSRPSEKLNYRWQKLNDNKLNDDLLEYQVRVISPTGELLIDEVTDELSLSLRNLSAEGNYSWQVTPIYDGVMGKETTASFNVAHPELPFYGDIETPITLNGTIQANGDVLFENGQPFYTIGWLDQKQSPDEKYLIEISKSTGFHSLHQRTFSTENFYSWSDDENGKFYLRVTRVSPFGNLKGTSNTVEINVQTIYPLPTIVKNIQHKKRIVKNRLRRKGTGKKIARRKKRVNRKPASIESQFEWKWSYLIPKEVMLSLGQGSIDFNQSSATTDANTNFSVQNIGLDVRFQESEDFYVDVEAMMRSTDVNSGGEFSDSSISLLVGKEWGLDFAGMSVLAGIGGRYSNVNYFEQNFSTDVESKQDNIFSATAQAGIIAPIGESIVNKLRVIVDMGALNQYGVKYNGRYKFADNKWFVDFSGGYFDGTYKLTDEFNEKSVDRSELQLFMGVGHSFK